MRNSTDIKNQILTIPNFLSLLRIALIPFIVWTYCGLKQPAVCFGLIFISGITDILDGFIARKFNMVSDVGKILDPIADKLTQCSVAICLTLQYQFMWLLITLFLVKESIMGIMGLVTFKKYAIVSSAKWYGKVNTVILYIAMIVLILFQNMPVALADALICICVLSVTISLVMYTNFYQRMWKGIK